MKKIVIICLFFLLIGVGYTKNISLDKFIILKDKLENIDKKTEKQIKNILNKSNIYDSKCMYYEKGNSMVISPICLLLDEFPKYGFKESVDIGLDYIVDFKNKYQLKSTDFVFQTSQPIFQNGVDKIQNLYDQNDSIFLLLLQNAGYNIIIPKIYFVYENLRNYSFYAAGKSLDNRGPCRIHNYLLAIGRLDKYILNPMEKLNFNSELVKIKDYCVQGNVGKYLFYEGVCGAASQIFRASLLDPYLKVLKRSPHAERYVNFYDNYVYGDDASVYEWQKQLEVQNIGEKPIYFRVWKNDLKKYLVSVYPSQSRHFTYIVKKNIQGLKSIVSKTVFNKSNLTIWYNQFRKSFYMKKNRE